MKSQPHHRRKRQICAGRMLADLTFHEKVWVITARIPPGKVTTYGHIARTLGTQAYRAVGHALNRNPYAPQVPCHRVVGHDGSLTGFAGGLKKKRQLLESEGVVFAGERVESGAIVRDF